MATLEGTLKKLASEYTHGYGSSPLPCQIDEEVESLVDVVTGDDEARTLLEMNETHGFVLLAYAERMASLAVRENSVDILSKGMAALGIASRLIYVKESLPVLALIHDSASKLGVDPPELFSTLPLHEGDELKAYVDSFLNRSGEDRSIQAMGYVEGEDEGGFRYSRPW